jgi:cyclophilin family peptidyl-prolyl cis-trans isomerase
LEIQYWPKGHLGPFFDMLNFIRYHNLHFIALIFGLFAGLSSCSSPENQITQSEPTPTPKETTDMKPTLVEEDIVTLTTDDGVIVIKLDSVNCPKHAENFKKLVKEGFYDGTTFHRVIPGFMIQGGDPKSKNADDRSYHGTGGPGYTVPAEIKNKHKRGTVSAARTGDEVNPQRNSSGSQFFICVTETAFLDGQYSAFGEVIEGMEVADKIVAKPRDPRDNPKTPVTIKAKLGRPKN